MQEKSYIPIEIWTPSSSDESLDEPIRVARDEMNLENTDELVHELKSRVQKSRGIAYAVLNGANPEEYSDNDALVLFDTFSVGPSSNRLVRAEFIRRVAYHSGVTDSTGKFNPVIFLASPGPGSTIRLHSHERQEVQC